MPDTPSAGNVKIYGKTDNNIYKKLPDGTESTLGGGASNPPGIVLPFAGATAPTGYLLCDGAAVSRTTYAALFAIIGITYGVGNGTTTFNLPDTRGRVPVGKSTDTEFDTLGKIGGEKLHTMTVAEMATHTHIQNAHSHFFTTVNDDFNGSGGNPPGFYTDSGGYREWYVNSVTATNQNAGSSTPFNVLQPYLTLNYIIKT